MNASILSSNLPVTNILQTGESDSQITKSWSVNPSLQQNLPGGGTATLSVNLNRTSTNGLYVFVNPVYTSTVGLTITQPLLRGFRRTAAERQIIISRLTEHISESQFRQKVVTVVEQVISAIGDWPWWLKNTRRGVCRVTWLSGNSRIRENVFMMDRRRRRHSARNARKSHLTIRN